MEHLTALTVFRHAVELGSFAATSRHLGLSPAAVSKNISELEAHLAVRLFNRTTRRMSLTEAGGLYYERIVRVLDDLAAADDVLRAAQATPKGLLRVSAPMTLTLLCLSTVVPKFLTRYPEVSLDLQLDDRYVNIVDQGFDLALRGSDNLEDSSLIARKLMDLRHVVCGSPAYFEQYGVPASPAELAKHSCIQFTPSSHANAWRFKQGDRTVTVPIKGRYKVNSSLAIRDALRAGFGLSLIPWIYVREDLREGHLQTVLAEWSPNEATVYAIYPSKRYLTSKVRGFLDFLIEEMSG
ncbi:MAG: LysR family transcriptional regulator [Cyanobacteria bacterium P01_D01_bin.6]